MLQLFSKTTTFFLLGFCLLAHAVWAEEAVPQKPLSFIEFDPAWLAGWLTKPSSEEQSPADGLPAAVDEALQQLQQKDIKVDSTRLSEFIAAYSTITNRVEEQAQRLPAMEFKSLSEAIALFHQSREVVKQKQAAETERDRLKLFIKSNAKENEKLILQYNKATELGKRVRFAVSIFTSQLEMEIARRHIDTLAGRINQYNNLLAEYQSKLNAGIFDIRPEANDFLVLEKESQDFQDEISKLDKQLNILEVKKLNSAQIESQSSDFDLVLVQSRKLELSSELLLNNLATNFLKAVSDQDFHNAAEEKRNLQLQQSQKTKIEKEYNTFIMKVSLGDMQTDVLNNLQIVSSALQKASKNHLEANFLLTSLSQVVNEKSSWWQINRYKLYHWTENVYEITKKILFYPLFSINNSPINLSSILLTLLFVTLALLLSSYLQKSLHRLGAQSQGMSEASYFVVGRIVHYLIVAAAVMISISTLGLDLSKLALIAGALSVGIGFGLQSIFNNFISGLILLFERPLKVGDLIELESGLRGRIKSINVRSTQITTWDNIDILVPNSEFISGRVTNYTFSSDLRRLHIPFGVAYGSDKDKVKDAAITAALRVSHTLNDEQHKPDVWLVNFGSSSLDFELVVWIKGNSLPKTKSPVSIYLWEVETALAEAGIEIPFPQTDLHVRSVEKDLLDRVTGPAGKNQPLD